MDTLSCNLDIRRKYSRVQMTESRLVDLCYSPPSTTSVSAQAPRALEKNWPTDRHKGDLRS